MIRSQIGKDKYDRLIRFLAMAAAVAVFWFSAQFSANGFNFTVPDMAYAGWGFAFVLIVVELVWNKQGAKHGVTLYLVGLICYAYGVYTNILGIDLASGYIGSSFMEFLKFSITHPVSLFGGIILELLPEPLIIWALTGSSLESDPAAHMMHFKQGIVPGDDRPIDRVRRNLGNYPDFYSETKKTVRK